MLIALSWCLIRGPTIARALTSPSRIEKDLGRNNGRRERAILCVRSKSSPGGRPWTRPDDEVGICPPSRTTRRRSAASARAVGDRVREGPDVLDADERCSKPRPTVVTATTCRDSLLVSGVRARHVASETPSRRGVGGTTTGRSLERSMIRRSRSSTRCAGATGSTRRVDPSGTTSG